MRGEGGAQFALDRLWPIRLELEVESETRVLGVDGRAARGTDGFSVARLQVRELSFTRPTPLRAARPIAG